MKSQLINSNCIRNSSIDALSSGWRLDLRKLLQPRRIYLRIGSQGSCTVRLGSTIVTAYASAIIVEPKASRPSEGMVRFNLNFVAPVAVSDNAVRPQEYVNELRTLLRDSIVQSGSIDLESLCVISGEKVFEINVNLNVLNSDGNVLDCASIASVASLSVCTLPPTSVEGRCMRIWNSYEKARNRLVMNHFPLFTTFCLFHEGKTLIVDPTEAEERLAESKLYIAVNARQEVCALKSVSKKRILPNELHKCLPIAEEHARRITALITEKLEQSKSTKNSLIFDNDHKTFAETFDINFDQPWQNLVTEFGGNLVDDNSTESKADPWGMEMAEDKSEKQEDKAPAIKQPAQEIPCDDEHVIVEHSEFSGDGRLAKRSKKK